MTAEKDFFFICNELQLPSCCHSAVVALCKRLVSVQCWASVALTISV